MQKLFYINSDEMAIPNPVSVIEIQRQMSVFLKQRYQDLGEVFLLGKVMQELSAAALSAPRLEALKFDPFLILICISAPGA